MKISDKKKKLIRSKLKEVGSLSSSASELIRTNDIERAAQLIINMKNLQLKSIEELLFEI